MITDPLSHAISQASPAAASLYASAVRSSNLRSKADTNMSDSDVIGAAGLAAKKSPLAIALMRLFTGDNRAATDIVRILTASVIGKAWHFYKLPLPRIEGEDISKAVLAWHRDGVCRVCGGHGFMVAGGGGLGEGRAVIGDAPCGACHGQGKVSFDRQFAMDRLELARWLRAEIEREQAIAGAEAMKALGPRMEL